MYYFAKKMACSKTEMGDPKDQYMVLQQKGLQF